MNPKLLILICVIVLTSALSKKGGKKGNKNDKDKFFKNFVDVLDNELDVILDEMCTGIEDGTMKNTDDAYNDVFKMIDPICDDLEAYMEGQDAEAEKVENEGDVAEYAKKGGKKGKKEDAKHILHGFCRKLKHEQANGFPEDTPQELLDIYSEMDPVCVEVHNIERGGPETGLVHICKGLADGKFQNSNPKYDDLFTRMDPICVKLLDYVEKTEDGPPPNDEKNGKNNGETDHSAVVKLLQFCWRHEDTMEQGLPKNMAKKLKKVLTDIVPICDDAMVISEGGKPKWSFNYLCEGLMSGEVKNTDSRFKKVFKLLKPVCNTYLKQRTQFGENNSNTSVKAKKGNKKGGNNKAVTILLSFCDSVVMVHTQEVPVDMPVHVIQMVEDIKPICKLAVKIASKIAE
ncbi:uncharacterized protein LOC132731648 [Ruditapes philippinarum]|uniref:uncharacterized protein LOC132731648 n=1 Tax=Ruditapes philippinarum TaxID=129788 RepID=UPI00295BE5E2|nr:uncharacterized protein LOC132731648 [Ruditapes philippinarum]